MTLSHNYRAVTATNDLVFSLGLPVFVVILEADTAGISPSCLIIDVRKLERCCYDAYCENVWRLSKAQKLIHCEQN